MQGCERVVDLGLGATIFVGHNRDAPETMPLHGRLHVWGPAARSREPRPKRDSDEASHARKMSSLGKGTWNAAPLRGSSHPIPALTAFSLHQYHNRARSNGVVDAKHLLFLSRLTDVVRRVLSGVDDAVPRLV